MGEWREGEWACRRCRRVDVVDGAGSVDNGPNGQEKIAQALAWVARPQRLQLL